MVETAQGSPATSMARAAGSEPKPVPSMVRSVPPASEPKLGLTAVMRGGSSASKGVPVGTSILRVATKPR